MSAVQAYRDLEAQEKRMSAIGGALSVLHWDRAVMMPRGGADIRGQQMAALSLVLHEMRTAPGRGELIAAAEAGNGALDAQQGANLAEAKRGYIRATALPARLVEALALASSGTEMIWREARKQGDFSLVSDKLGELVALVREEAAILGAALQLDPYDALIDGYDPGLRHGVIEPIFDAMAKAIPPLLDSVLEHQARTGAPLALDGPFDTAIQEQLGRTIMERLGFDFAHGRLDVSEHPFTGGVPDDSRITTRYSKDDFIQALMGVIHETGHSLYERGLPKDWRGQPGGRARGMTLHESQSLLFEMQAARGPAYISFLSRLVREAFAKSGPAWEPDNLLKHYHKVSRGLIRVHADEISYPLHIILRTRLERAMVAGSLEAGDLPDAWNEGMQELLGIAPPDDRQGCLQDIHWYSGSFGYFPTYTLGALAAAQLFQAANLAHPEIETELADGRAATLLAWLRANIHEQASFAATGDILAHATGKPLGVEAFLTHLRARYLQE